MFDDDEEVVRARQAARPNLDDMSIEDLGEYIASLEAEISRARAEIERREQHRDAAAQVFKI